MASAEESRHAPEAARRADAAVAGQESFFGSLALLVGLIAARARLKNRLAAQYTVMQKGSKAFGRSNFFATVAVLLASILARWRGEMLLRAPRLIYARVDVVSQLPSARISGSPTVPVFRLTLQPFHSCRTRSRGTKKPNSSRPMWA